MKRMIASFSHAFRGIFLFIKTGTNAKLQLLAALLISITGAGLGFSRFEWISVLLCIALVLSLEAINTAIELLADEITREWKPIIRDIKDIAAGAVLISSIASAIIGSVIIWNHI